MIKKLIPEFIGTYIIVFYSISLIFTEQKLYHISCLGIFFLYSSLIYAFKDVCEVYFNPLLTISLLIAKRHSYIEHLLILLSQTVAIVLAILSIKLIFSYNNTYTTIDKTSYKNLYFSFLGSFFLVWTYQSLFSNIKAPKYVSGITMGAIYGVNYLIFTKYISKYLDIGIISFLLIEGNYISNIFTQLSVSLSAGILSGLLYEYVMKKEYLDDELEQNQTVNSKIKTE